MMLLSEYLLRDLKRRGVARIFGVPGRENAAIGFNEVEGVELVTTRVEFNAGVMASVAGQMSRRLQVAFATMGPGATNMVTAAASAMLNRSPVIFIAAQLERDDCYYNLTHQCVNQAAIFAPVTKWSHELTTAAELPRVLEQAVATACTEPVGPVFLSIPTDLFAESVDAPLLPGFHPGVVTHQRPAAPESAVEKLVAMIERSQRPMVLAGQEATRSGASKIVRQLVEELGLPLVTAANAKGILPPDHPLNFGSASCYMEGILGRSSLLREMFEPTDLLLCVGYQYVDDILPKMWEYGETTVAEIGLIGNAAVDEKFRPELSVLGPIGDTLERVLGRRLAKKAPRSAQSIQALTREAMSKPGASGLLTPGNVVAAINEVIADGILVTDIGYYRHHANLFAQPATTERFFTDTGLSSFGSGLPSAAAAQLLHPDKRVVLLCGDGGFHSGSGDLETLVRRRLPVVIIVLNNSSYGLIGLYQRRGGQNNPSAVDFSPVDFAALARANGAAGASATSAAEIKALVLGHREPTPLVIDVPVDYTNAATFEISF